MCMSRLRVVEVAESIGSGAREQAAYQQSQGHKTLIYKVAAVARVSSEWDECSRAQEGALADYTEGDGSMCSNDVAATTRLRPCTFA